jgi:hypothetical protein
MILAFMGHPSFPILKIPQAINLKLLEVSNLYAEGAAETIWQAKMCRSPFERPAGTGAARDAAMIPE